MITIREENTQDHEAIRGINKQAFAAEGESRIIDNLRDNCSDIISLVAESDGQVVGHILFSPVTVSHGGSEIVGMGLAPMSVHPDYQNQGIGSKLVQQGLQRIIQTDCPFVIVLGHQHYYPRFGFEPAVKFGLQSQWEGIPDEVFMAMILDQPRMSGISGIATYRHEFNDAL